MVTAVVAVDAVAVAASLVAVEAAAEAVPQGATLSSANYVTNQAIRASIAGIGLIRIFNPLLHHHLPMHTSLQPILLSHSLNPRHIPHRILPLLLLGILVRHHLCLLTLPQLQHLNLSMMQRGILI